MTESRKLAAILAADVVGFSRLTGADEDRTLARLRALRSDLIDPTIAVHNGRVVKRTGDGALVEFRSVVDAVRCAIEVQNATRGEILLQLYSANPAPAEDAFLTAIAIAKQQGTRSFELRAALSLAKLYRATA